MIGGLHSTFLKVDFFVDTVRLSSGGKHDSDFVFSAEGGAFPRRRMSSRNGRGVTGIIVGDGRKFGGKEFLTDKNIEQRWSNI